ncbi:hypothetical protein RND71_014531 [Anisodus tanguticus]|uniref:Uncharacterized protein n=1 Tax=Anisodus tanguticus TaxID=243964 RepID=A0AAE1SCZ2_9SOLA|nr:hypothetical protein RND71_014531 [Anisodus tanguticus]
MEGESIFPLINSYWLALRRSLRLFRRDDLANDTCPWSRGPYCGLASGRPAYADGADFVRGYPFSLRQGVPTAVSHGLWLNIHDYDAPTQLVKPLERNTRIKS